MTTIAPTQPTTTDPTNDQKAPQTMTTTTSTLTPAPARPEGPTPTPAPVASAPAAATTGNRVSFARLVSAEWLKFRTVRSNLTALAGAAGAAIGFGVLFSWLAESDEGPNRFATDGLSLSLGGFDLAQIIIAILGVALVAGEYQTGLIRSWFAAAPSRLKVLGSKVTVFSLVVLVATAIAAVVAFVAGQAVLPDSVTALSLTDDGVLQALAGTAFYSACIAAMGIGLGFLLRSTAAGAGAVVSLLMLGPLMISLLPSWIADPVGKILPSNAADAVTGMAGTGTEVLSTGWGVAVLVAWVVGIVGSAAIMVQRRDA